MKYHYFLPYYSIFSHIPLTKVDPNVDITLFLTLTKFLSLTGLKNSFYVDRNNHLLNATFAVLVYSGFRALPPLASGQHPLFLVKIIHSWPKLAPGLDTFAGSVFFIYDIWLNLASTYCASLMHPLKEHFWSLHRMNGMFQRSWLPYENIFHNKSLLIHVFNFAPWSSVLTINYDAFWGK